MTSAVDLLDVTAQVESDLAEWVDLRQAIHDRAVVSVLDGSGAPADAIATIRLLADVLASHVSYEERQLAEPLGLLGIGV